MLGLTESYNIVRRFGSALIVRIKYKEISCQSQENL